MGIYIGSDNDLLMRTHVQLTLGLVGVVEVLVADAPNFEKAKGAKFRRQPPFLFVSEQSRMSTLSVQTV